MSRAHPRSRGENQVAGSLASGKRGSSPLTRGKPTPATSSCPRPRLIPAHAGKTSCSSPSRPSTRAHPRSRGENEHVNGDRAEVGGSSPLTRGKRRRNRIRGLDPGLIPAHAGKTTAAPALTFPIRAHPRSRGENLHKAANASCVKGSSPLTRGKRRHRPPRPRRRRLIPAHAGKTPTRLASRRRGRAHPRSRGENLTRLALTIEGAGSSPLTRGKRTPSRRDRDRRRLIPAHAGKTTAASTGAPTSRAHPRSRGENGTRSDLAYVTEGSSPLTRGKLLVALSACDASGLIPAHAGKTRSRLCWTPSSRAHPRSRGENM